MGTKGLYGIEVDTSDWDEKDGMLFPPFVKNWERICSTADFCTRIGFNPNGAMVRAIRRYAGRYYIRQSNYYMTRKSNDV